MVPSVEEVQHIIAGWYSSSGPFAGTFEIELPPLATYRNSANGRRWSMRCELTRDTVFRKDSLRRGILYSLGHIRPQPLATHASHHACHQSSRTASMQVPHVSRLGRRILRHV